MSTAGRAYLKQLFGTVQYRTWANASSGNKIDANKIARKYAGEPTPRPGSAYGQSIWGLCAENPPEGVPVPPPPSGDAVAAVWKLDAAFTEGGLSNFAGAPRDRAWQLGWRAIYVQLLHTNYVDDNLQEMQHIAGQGWTMVGWGTYGQGADPEQDGKDAAAMCKAHPLLKAWKANGEAWAEAQYAWKTAAFLKGWVEGGAPVPLGWSVLSSDTANFARAFDYRTALSVVGADIDIQVYGASYPTYTVGAGLGMLAKASVPPSRTTMSFDVNGDGNGPFPDYRTWAGPRRLWQPDKATVATFDALVR